MLSVSQKGSTPSGIHHTAWILFLCLSATIDAARLLRSSPSPASAASLSSILAPKCVPGRYGADVCTVYPGYVFSLAQELTTKEQPTDRFYQAIMAQHLLCQARQTRQACESVASLSCNWDPRQQTCRADKYASYLIPLTCPGSKARSFLNCMRTPNRKTCLATSSCFVHNATSCLPLWVPDEATRQDKTVQALSEQVALSLARGDPSVLGDCPGANIMQRLSQLCPVDSEWEECNLNYCGFDVPPFIPRRPEQQRNTQNNQTKSKHTRTSGSTLLRLAGDSQQMGKNDAVLAYMGVYPAPICTLDVERLPSVLHELLNVNKHWQEAISDAQMGCKDADTVWYDVKKQTAACGGSTFNYSVNCVLAAARNQAAASPAR